MPQRFGTEKGGSIKHSAGPLGEILFSSHLVLGDGGIHCWRKTGRTGLFMLVVVPWVPGLLGKGESLGQSMEL